MSWYKMERGWMDNPVFKKEPYTEQQAWLWLVEHAVWKDTSTFANGRNIDLKRGDLSYSLSFLAEVWTWTKSRTNRYVNRLKTAHMIETATETGRLVITICNYSKYQDQRNATETESETPAKRQRNASETNKKNKEIRTKKSTLVPIVQNRFVEFWELYPRQRRGARSNAEKKYNQILAENKATEEEIINGVTRYAQSREVAEGYGKGAVAWLNDDRWTHEYSNEPTSGNNSKTKPSYTDILAAASRQAQAVRNVQSGSEGCGGQSSGGLEQGGRTLSNGYSE